MYTGTKIKIKKNFMANMEVQKANATSEYNDKKQKSQRLKHRCRAPWGSCNGQYNKQDYDMYFYKKLKNVIYMYFEV